MMTTKAFACYFILMTLVNLPVMWLYYSANLGDVAPADEIEVSAF